MVIYSRIEKGIIHYNVVTNDINLHITSDYIYDKDLFIKDFDTYSKMYEFSINS
jgi:hypothetical protein